MLTIMTVLISFKQINWDQPAERIHHFIRGNDKVPGAWTEVDGEKVTFYGSRMWDGSIPNGTEVELGAGLSKKAIVHDGGLLLFGNDSKAVSTRDSGRPS